MLRYIDLFAGIGGTRLGFSDYGHDKDTKCVFASEWDKFAQKTYHADFGMMPKGDISKISAKEIPKFDVLLAGFPCQPFSAIGKRQGFKNPTQGTCFFDVLRIIRYHHPKAFLLENVAGLLTIQRHKTFHLIEKLLKNSGYQVKYRVLQATNFGLAQNRQRVIIVGIRNDIDCNNFYIPTHNNKPIVYIRDILQDDPDGYSISKRLQHNYLFKKDDGYPYVVDKSTKGFTKTLNASYHKIQRITGTFVKGGKTGLRLLSRIECKRLQGFPDNFKMPVSRTQMYRQLGNSVPVPMIKAVSDQLKKTLKED